MIWYSLSVSVSAGATVIESPVWTPIGIDVLDRADDDGVVGAVAHDLHLVFLPAEHALLDEDLRGRGCVEAALDDLDIFVPVVGDAAARAAHGEGRADDGRQADVVHAGQRLADSEPTWWERGVARPIFVMASRNSSRSSALSMAAAVAPISSTSCSFSVPIFSRARAQFSAVWPPMVGQESEATRHGMALGRDDLRHDLGRDGLDIGPVRHVRVGHDGGRVGVDQHDPVAVLAQRLAGLGARIVELAGLPDDDRAGPDDHDRGDVGALRHQSGPTDSRVVVGRAGARLLEQGRSQRKHRCAPTCKDLAWPIRKRAPPAGLRPRWSVTRPKHPSRWGPLAAGPRRFSPGSSRITSGA